MDKVKLGEVLEVKRGMSLPGKYYSSTGDVIRLTLGNFDYPGGGFKPNTSKENLYYSGTVPREYLLDEGAIITPLTEQVAGLLGETARIPCGGVYVQSGDIGLVVPDPQRLDDSFAYYLLSSELVKKQLSAGAQQTKIRHTSPAAIHDVIAFLPPLKQQKLMGSLLDAITDKIANNKKLMAELEETARLIYDYWFTQFDFPDENGRPYRSSGGKMVWNDELKREIPAGWHAGNLYEIANYINGLACQRYRPVEGDPGLPVVKIREMHDGIGPDTERVTSDIPKRNIIQAGDILFSWSASLEVMYWLGVHAGLNQHIFKVEPKLSDSKEYVYHVLKGYIVRFVRMAEARKTTMGHVTSDHLDQSRVPIPPEKVLQQYHSIAGPLHAEMVHLGTELRELFSLRSWLLPMLMNGQLSVE